MRQMVKALFHADADPGLVKQVEQKMLKHSPVMAAALMEFFADYDLPAVIKQVRVPIRCINGDLFPTDVEKNRTLHPDFDAVILPHTGHYPMLENPHQFNRNLQTLLTEWVAK